MFFLDISKAFKGKPDKRRPFCEAARKRLPSLGILLLVTGCAGYQIGARSLFPTHIQTVHVPIARNDTFRHDLGIRLTEAIIRTLETRTPYKVVDQISADSVLTVRFLSEGKKVLTETNSDDPRALDANITIQAAWVDRQGTMLMQNRFLPGRDLALTFSSASRLVPEGGQSIESETQQAIQVLASRIVSQMEMRW